MKRSSNSSEIGVSNKKFQESQVVVVELGLKLQQDNQNRPFRAGDDHDHGDDDVSGPTCDGHNIKSVNISDNNTTIYDLVGATAVGDSFSSVPCTVRGLQPFDVSSSYYSPANPFFKSSGGMATAAMGFPFTAAQWKELERQAMIYKYMMASLPVPHDLLYSSFPTNLTPSSNFTPASYFMGKYGSGLSMRWSGNSKDAEPGRCRRTDGKKWRCSRDVAPNQKYCERHMHRGRPRSRKHVEQQQQQQLLNQNHSLSDLPIINNNKLKNSPTKKSRMDDCSNPQPVGSSAVQQSKASIFDHPMVSSANPFEDSRSLAWSNEQQWHQLVQNNMNSSVFQQQFEGEPLNLNSNAGYNAKSDMGLLERPLIDAWSMGVTETKDNGGNNNNKSSLSSSNGGHGNAINEEMCQIHMGLGLIDSWVASSTTPGGPLAEVLRPGSAANPAMSDAGEAEFVTPPATAVSSPSGVLQKTLATFSDSSGSTSPACHNSRTNSDMPFHWLN